MKWFNFHHSFRDLVPAEEYFDAHPEYFSEIEGRRVPDKQICLTNPDILAIAKAKLKEWIRDIQCSPWRRTTHTDPACAPPAVP